MVDVVCILILSTVVKRLQSISVALVLLVFLVLLVLHWHRRGRRWVRRERLAHDCIVRRVAHVARITNTADWSHSRIPTSATGTIAAGAHSTARNSGYDTTAVRWFWH